MDPARVMFDCPAVWIGADHIEHHCTALDDHSAHYAWLDDDTIVEWALEDMRREPAW